MHPEEQFAIRALKTGASGYLTKETAPEDLIEAIRRVSRGLKYVTPSVAEKLTNDIRSDHLKPLHEKLSNREYEIMCMLVSGKKNREIAKELFLSEKTVSSYKRRILDKMGLRTNADLTRNAVRLHLIEG